MTNFVPLASIHHLPAMSTRRPNQPTSQSSYAAVLTGQARQLPPPTDINGHGTPNFTYNHNNPNIYLADLAQQDYVLERPVTVPSYLVDSAYAERLVSAKDPPVSPVMPAVGSMLSGLSTTASGKKPQNIRGVAVEQNNTNNNHSAGAGYRHHHHQPANNELAGCLPTRWNGIEKPLAIEVLGDGTEVRLVGRSVSICRVVGADWFRRSSQKRR